MSRPRLTLSPGMAFEVTPAQSADDEYMRIRLCKYINQKRGSAAAKRFIDLSKQKGPQAALDPLWAYLNDWGAFSGLSFDVLNLETVDNDGVARYGWLPMRDQSKK
jgi:hypothetical protein